MAISNTQLRIERSISEVIRNLLVSEGYWPDVTDFSYDDLGRAAFEAAVDVIILDKGFAIELFTSSSSRSRGKKRYPRIVVGDLEYFPGDIGHPFQGGYSKSGQDYHKQKIQQTTSRGMIDVTMVTESITQDRVCQSILAQAFSRRAYIEYYDSPGEYFLMVNQNLPFNTLDADQGLRNKVYRYEIPDILESENVTTDENISRILEITLEESAVDSDVNLAVYSGYCEYFLGSLTDKQKACLMISAIDGGAPDAIFEPTIGIFGGTP